jgi:hypothetical protein
VGYILQGAIMMDDPDVKERISEINKSMLLLARSILDEGAIPQRSRVKPLSIPGSHIPKERQCKKSSKK